MGLFSLKKFREFQQKEQTLKKQTIMVVDDEVSNITTLTALFGKHYNLMVAKDGLDAFEQVKKLPDPRSIDLIISDQRMPCMTGVELFQELNGLDTKAKRVILTGHADAKMLRDAHEKACVNKVLLKPYEREELLQTVTGILNG